MLAAFDIDARHKRSLFEACLGRMIEAWSGAPLAGGNPIENILRSIFGN